MPGEGRGGRRKKLRDAGRLLTRWSDRLARKAAGEPPRAIDLVPCVDCGGAECEACGGGGMVEVDEREGLAELEELTPGLVECVRVRQFVKAHGLGLVGEFLYPISPECLEAIGIIDAGADEEEGVIAAERAGEKK